MMVLLNLLFLFVMGAVGYAVFLAVWLAAVWTLHLRRKWLCAILSFPAYVAIVLAISLISSSPSTVFCRSFGFPPANDVVDIQSSCWHLGDAGTTYLHFRAEPQTIERIVARGMTPLGTSARQCRDLRTNDAPDWWRPVLGGDVVVYYGEFDGRTFARETEWLAYCQRTKETWFHFSGID
jgi:hypothetical protein